MSIRQRLNDHEKLELLRSVHQEDVERAVAAAQAEWVPQAALVDAVHQILMELGQSPSAPQTFDA